MLSATGMYTALAMTTALTATACSFDTSGLAVDPSPIADARAADAPVMTDARTADASPLPDAAPAPDAPATDAPLPDAAPGPDAPLPACLTNPAYTPDPATGRRYRVFSGSFEGRHWTTARTNCANDQAYLVVVDSHAENDHVRSLHNGNELWIGLHDRTVEGDFQWVNNAPLGFTNWNGGEPNDANGEDCVEMRDDGRWNDRECDTYRRYVCECDPTYIP